MVIYSTPFSEIEFIDGLEVLQITWHAKPTDAAFTETYHTALRYVAEQNKVILFCTDLTKSGPFNREQELWLNTSYYNEVYDGIKEDIFVAVVFSDPHFNAVVTNYMAPETTDQHEFICFNYFTRLSEAQHWLDTIKKGHNAVAFQASSL